jgi:hypothetical protein
MGNNTWVHQARYSHNFEALALLIGYSKLILLLHVIMGEIVGAKT